jgi:hypothetical protein
MRSLLLTISALAVTLSLSQVQAAPKFNGSVGYAFANNGKSIVIKAGLVENTSKTATTGTPRLTVWATTKPYAGGSISGHVLGMAQLQQLKGGQYYRDLSRTVNYTAPPRQGTYFITVALSEFSDGGYGIVDYRTMPKALTLSPPAPVKTMTLNGPYRWQTHPSDGTITIEAAKVSHTRKGKTGTLKISVWATDAPYRGGSLNGYQLGYFTKEGLDPGYSYTNLKRDTAFKAPPSGTYSITFALSEYQEGGYAIMDYYTLKDWATF